MNTAMPPETAGAAMMSREVDRFILAARERGEYDAVARRRTMRRYHRSWPLLIGNSNGDDEISAALHNASANGIGFLCGRAFAVGQLVLIKLFWHDEAGLWVPAAVRHVTPCHNAMLIGCEFALGDESACQAGLYTDHWYG